MTEEMQSTVTPAQPAQQPATDGVTSGSSNSALTQEHVNKLVGEARKEGKSTATNDILKALGVASLDELKALKDKARELETSKMTESEKLQAERDTAKKEKEDAIAQLQAERAERRNDKIAAYVQAEAGKLKANDPETVLLYAREKHKSDLESLLGEDGTFDAKKTAALLDKIKSEKAVYFAPPAPVNGFQSNAGGRSITQQKPPDTSKYRV